MYVNTSVVKALMQLRGITDAALASLCHVTLADLRAWLNEQGENSAERVEFDTQLEILRILGVTGEQPRGDLVHYWRIHENLFSRASDNYWALQVLLKAFGKAQASFITPESDPTLTFSAKAHFGLRFKHFLAILEVTAHPLRSISFDPSLLPDVEWIPEVIGVLLPEADYAKLEPGAMKVRGLHQYLTYTTEVSQWEQLRDKALEQGIRAEQVAAVLLGAGLPPLVQHDPSVVSTQVESATATAEPASEASEPQPAVAAQAAAPVAAAPVAPQPHVEQTAVEDDNALFRTPVRPVVQQAEPASVTHLKRVV